MMTGRCWSRHRIDMMTWPLDCQRILERVREGAEEVEWPGYGRWYQGWDEDPTYMLTRATDP
jgi:hypothetical protein